MSSVAAERPKRSISSTIKEFIWGKPSESEFGTFPEHSKQEKPYQNDVPKDNIEPIASSEPRKGLRELVVVYEGDSQVRPPVLPILPVQRLRLLRQKQEWRKRNDLNYLYLLPSNKASPAISKLNMSNLSYKSSATPSPTKANQVVAPALKKKKTTNNGSKGTKWSGEFEYDLAEYDTIERPATPQVSAEKSAVGALKNPSVDQDVNSNQLSSIQRKVLLNGPQSILPKEKSDKKEETVKHVKKDEKVILPSVGFDFIKSSDTPSKVRTQQRDEEDEGEPKRKRQITEPAKPSFQFGAGAEEKKDEQPKPLFSFGAKKDEQPKPSFSFGAKKDEQPKPSFSFGAKKDEQPKPSFSFGAKKDEEKPKPSFSFGAKKDEEQPKPSFSFGAKKDDEQPKPSFSFGAKKDEQPKPSFSFGAKKDEQPKPSFSFGAKKDEEQPKPSFGFGAKKDEEQPKPSFNFGAKKDEEQPKPSFSFGAKDDDKSKPATPSFSFGPKKDEAAAEKPSFTFGAKDKPSFSFGAKPDEAKPEAKTDSKPSFSFSATGTSKPAFSFGANKEATTQPSGNDTSKQGDKSNGFSFNRLGQGIQQPSLGTAAPVAAPSAPTFSFGAGAGAGAGADNKPPASNGPSVFAPTPQTAAKPFSFSRPNSTPSWPSQPGSAASDNPPSFNFKFGAGGPSLPTAQPAAATNSLGNNPFVNKPSGFSFGGNGAGPFGASQASTPSPGAPALPFGNSISPPTVPSFDPTKRTFTPSNSINLNFGGNAASADPSSIFSGASTGSQPISGTAPTPQQVFGGAQTPAPMFGGGPQPSAAGAGFGGAATGMPQNPSQPPVSNFQLPPGRKLARMKQSRRA